MISRRLPVAIAGVRASAALRSAKLTSSADVEEDTVLDDAAKHHVKGLAKETFTASGFSPRALTLLAPYQGGAVRWAAGSVPGGAVGTHAVFGELELLSFEQGSEIGKPRTLELAGVGHGTLDGVIAWNGFYDAGAVAGTTAGAVFQLPALGPAEKLVAQLHVVDPLAGAAPELTVRLLSDASPAFAGEEIERLTFPPLTTPGSERRELAGPVSDRYWRAVVELAGEEARAVVLAVVAVVPL